MEKEIMVKVQLKDSNDNVLEEFIHPVSEEIYKLMRGD